MHCRMIMREKEIFYKSKFSLTPKRKVASYVGRLCEEGKEIFYKSKLSLTPKRKVASYVGRLCEEGKFQFDYFPSHRKIKLFTSHL